MFEYDSEKAASNLTKHGVSFREAAEVFDHDYIEIEDARAVGEIRYRVLGWSHSRLLVLAVIYTPRENRIRFISARRATRNEEREYHEYITG